MKTIVRKYSGIPLHKIDYTALLEETNIFGLGKNLIYDENACRKIVTLLTEAETLLDFQTAFRILQGKPADLDEMKVTSELEYWAFARNGKFSRMLFIGSGGYPVTPFYLLQRVPRLQIDALDIVPNCTALCSQITEKLGFTGRLHPFTGNVLEFEKEFLKKYDSFFLASAVRPKNKIIQHLLSLKRKGSRIYAREDEAHPYFYEPITVKHRDLISARMAKGMWLKAKGTPYPLPKGCET